MTTPALQRTVGLPGAVLLGLGSILGTGAFIALGLAVGIAGTSAQPALLIAALLATCNALSSAQLAAAHPVSGGTYAYGYRYLSPSAGFLAGTCFMLAKSASAAAAALGLALYLAPAMGLGSLPSNLLAAGLVLLMTALVATGLRRANLLNTALVGMTVTALVWLILASFFTDAPPPATALANASGPNIAQATALLFVAFTGYGRIATLGEEVKNPRRIIPQAILITLGVAALLYFGLLWTGLRSLGWDGFALTSRPLLDMAASVQLRPLTLAVLIAAATAMAGVLLNLLLGLSRVALAMARERDLPRVFAQLSRRSHPTYAVWGVGLIIAIIAVIGGLQLVWSFSAFTVLIYYAVTNICALRLPHTDRLYPRAISWLGLMGCLGLAVFVDWRAIIPGLGLIAAAFILRQILR